MAKLLKSWIFWLVAAPLLLVGLYALVGFKVAPGIVRDQAQKFVRENYGRELQVGAVTLQPFKLQAEVRDLVFPDSDGRPMLAFERLFADFELSSLWHRAFTFSQLTIEAPQVRAVVRPDGSVNLADLALPEDPDEPDEPLPSIWIRQLDVERGTADFVDQARRVPYERAFHAIGFELDDFRTTPEGGGFNLSARSKEDETFDWKGRFTLEPEISSQGDFRIGALRTPGLLDYLGDARPFTSTTGTMDIAGSYRMRLADQLELDVELPTIDVKDLTLLARDADAPWVRIPSVVVAGVVAAIPAQTVKVDRVAIDALTAQAWLAADGTINLERLFSAPAPIESAPAPAEQPAAAPAVAAANPPAPPVQAEPAAAERPWTVAVGSIDVTNAAIDFEDRAFAPVTRFRFAPVNVRLADASLDLSRPLPITLDAVINEHAAFTARGSLTPEPLAADLDIKLDRARMTILQPYVLPLADLTITGGELGVTGKAKLAPPGSGGPELSFDGEVAIGAFKSVDNATRQDLVSFAHLGLGEVQYAMAPDSLSIGRIDVRQPYARVIITPDRVINIAAVLDPQGTAKALQERRAAEAAEAALTEEQRRRIEREQKAAEKAAAKARKAGTAPPPPAATEPVAPDSFPVRIREVRIVDGRVNFTDNFIQPNFSADVHKLSGTLSGLSSAVDSRARVDLEGQLDEFSPVTITGELQPFAFDRHADVKLRFANISLPIFNPYSGSLAGYNIAKGKLTTDLHYVIENRALDAQHKIRIDQLEWGEATDTKGEATLPVKFATSLLKDKDGVINLDVPVTGTLDDPKFRIGPIVWQIIKNLLTKAVTAPFALLGGLFAGAEEAQFVDFAPGDATLDAATGERLAALGKSLVEKPELKLDVPLGALAEVDGPALSERAYRAALDEAAAGQAVEGAVSTYEALTPEQKVAALTAQLRQRTGAVPVVPEPPAPPDGTSRKEARALREAAAVEHLEAALRASVTASAAAIDRLAEDRAKAIESALLADSGLDPTRVFKVREGKVTANEGKVRFELGLE